MRSARLQAPKCPPRRSPGRPCTSVTRSGLFRRFLLWAARLVTRNDAGVTLLGWSFSGIAATAGAVSSYDIDRLLRPSQPTASTTDNAEVAPGIVRIVVNGMSAGDVPEADCSRFARLVAARTDVAEQEARTRVDQSIANTRSAATKAQAAAETARRTSATLALLPALSMLVGAFIASVSAGRLRRHGPRHLEHLRLKPWDIHRAGSTPEPHSILAQRCPKLPPRPA